MRKASLKNITSLLLAAAMSFSFLACGGKQSIESLLIESDAFMARGNMEKAQQKALQAEDMLNGDSDLKNCERVYRLLAVIYLSQNNVPKGISYNRKALEYAQRMNDSSLIETNVYNLGLGLAGSEMKNFDEAKSCFRRAAEMGAARGDSSITATSLDKLAKVYIVEGEFDMAEDCLDKALEYGHGQSVSMMENCESRSQLAYSKGDMDGALKEYESLADSSLNINGKYQKYFAICDILTRKGDYRMALQYRDSVQLYHDSIYKLDGTARSEEIEKQYHADIEQRQHDFRTLLWISMGVFVFMLAILLLVMKNLRLKKNRLMLTDKIASLNSRIAELLPPSSQVDDGKPQIPAVDIDSIVGLLRQKFELSLEFFKGLQQYSLLSKLNLIRDFTPEHRLEIKDVYNAIVGRFSDCCSDVRQAFPGMTGDDAVYCAMSFIGCCKEVISVALGSSEEALRRRKSRIKQKLPLSLFLFFFSK